MKQLMSFTIIIVINVLIGPVMSLDELKASLKPAVTVVPNDGASLFRALLGPDPS